MSSDRDVLPDQEARPESLAEKIRRAKITLSSGSTNLALVQLGFATGAARDLETERDRISKAFADVSREVLAWAEPRVSLMSPPRVPEAAQSMAYEIDRLRAQVTHLKEEQVSLVGSLGDAQAEVEKLREAARETLGAIEDRWDGTDKSPLWGLGDALETALETDETEAHRG